MATPKIQNAYRNPSSDTEDIADLLLVTTSGLATDGDAGASFIVFHNGSNDVLVSSSNALPVSVSGVATAANQATANGLLTTMDADTGTIATHAATLAGAVSGTEVQVDIVSGTVTVTGVSTLAEQQSQTTLLGTIDADTGNIATSTTDLPNVIGTDGSAGPSKAVSVAGTESGGALQELRVDADGHLQIDVLSTTGTTTVSGTVDLGATDNAVLDAIAASVASTDGKITACNTGAVVVSSSALPSGAATAAKQPALGTAGTASSDVITIQGVASMTPIQIADNGGAITVDNGGTFAVQAAQSGTWNITNVSGTVSLPTGASTLAEQQSQTTHLATIAGDTTNIETAVQLIDDSVVAVDAVGTSAKVLMQGAIRDDALSTLTPVEGDAVNLRTDANGALWVNPGTVAVTGTFWQATQPVSGTVTADAGTNLNTSALALESGGNLASVKTAVELIDDAVHSGFKTNALVKYVVVGAEEAGDTGNVMALQVNPAGALHVDASFGGTMLVKGESTNDDPTSGYFLIVGGRASAAAPTNVSADGDGVFSWHLLNGQQVIQPAFSGTLASVGNGASGSGVQRVTIANDSTGVIATVSTVTTVSTLTGGGVAHDSADSGNPIKVGARAAATLSDDTMVANADRTDAVSDLDGALIVRPGFPLGDLISERVTDTGGSSTAFTNFGATASTRSYITAITVYNSSATAGTIDFRDGTGGSVLWTVPIPATGGAVIANGGVPLFCTTANTALAYDVSAALTTVTISVSGFKSKARA